MATNGRAGHIQFCVEVRLSAQQTSLSAHRNLLNTCQQLQVMFAGQQIRPTWALDSTVLDATSGALDGESELALLVSSPAELDEYIHAAKRSVTKMRFASVVTRFDPTLLQVAELSALGARAVGLPLVAVPRATRVQTRHGLSLVRTTGSLPGYGKFLGRWDAAFQAKGLLHRAMLRKSTEVISVQLDHLNHSMKTLRTLQRTLTAVQRLESAGRIASETLLQTHARHCPANGVDRAQRSVLRAA